MRRVIRTPRQAVFAFTAAARWATITPVPMPALSPTMEQGTITEWVKKVGDQVNPGDTWAQVETDKATVAFKNTSEEGFLARRLVEAGSGTVKVGEIIALLVEEEADINSQDVKNWKPDSSSTDELAAAPAKNEEVKKNDPPAQPTGAASSGSSSRIFASPLAKKTAAERGVDLSEVKGTGGSVGRVTKDDVLSHKPREKSSATSDGRQPVAQQSASNRPAQSVASSPSESFDEVPLSGMRKTIASRLLTAKNEAPHYYETVACVVDNMSDLIKHLNSKGDGKFKITVNDFLIKAIARANLIVPECNTHWYGDHLRRYKGVDVSVAVATPTGLITPIVRDAHVKGLASISEEVKALAKRAKAGELQPSEYQGGTVTISNLGGMGINQFTAIINPPHSMILAVGNIRPQPQMRLNSEGEYEMTGKVEKTMTFTASFDHRVVDGAVGAEWFKHFKDTVENPLSLLL